MPTLAIFQLYRGVTKFITNLDTYKTMRNKTLTYFFIKQSDYIYK